VPYSFIFVKDKTRPGGTFESVKARMVCNGANQKDHMFELISSATVGLTSVFIVLNIATYFECKVRTFDIKGAFLHAEFTPQDEIIYTKVSKEVASIWVTLDLTALEFLDHKGKLLLQLDKFIYGLKQSPYKWQKLLTTVLERLGYCKLVHEGRRYHGTAQPGGAMRPSLYQYISRTSAG
jgi:hypothetical protein